MKPSSDHEVKNEPEVVFKSDADTFSKPAESNDFFPFQTRQRRIHRTKQKRAGDLDSLERLSLNTFIEGLNVDHDVGKFGHDFVNRT